jgi:DNA modification methylase
MTDIWENCYSIPWGKNLVPEAFSHPAKVSFSLAGKIYDHAINMGWVKRGDYVLDPFGGICGFGFHAMCHGLNFLAVELEEKFVSLGQQNIDLWNRQLKGWPNLGTARIVQGDSRNLREVMWNARNLGPSDIAKSGLRGTLNQADLVVSSPPYHEGLGHGGTPTRKGGRKDDRNLDAMQDGYGHTPGNLANLKEGNFEHFLLSDLENRFWAKVIKADACWEWKGKKQNKGYGRILIDGKEISAHRISWEIHFGPIPEGLMVCHHCDNPGCVRPDHLFLGTMQDNWQDSSDKGRNPIFNKHLHQAKGENHGRAKLTEVQVTEIREKYSKGNTSYSILAKEYGVSHNVIGQIIHKKIWKSSLANLKEGKFELVVGSPPYAEQSIQKNSPSIDRKKQYKTYRSQGGGASFEAFCRTQELHSQDYGSSEGQLGSLKEGDFDLICSSPPYAETSTDKPMTDEERQKFIEGQRKSHPGRSDKALIKMTHKWTGYPDSLGQLGKMPEGSFDAVVSSPPYSDIRQDGGSSRNGYKGLTNYSGEPRNYWPTQRDQGNLGNVPPDTFWSASRIILEQCYKLLKPGGHAIWVTKSYCKKGAIVDFPGRWKTLCESVGFKLVCRHKAMLVKSFGKQITITGEDEEISVERKSFFRRLAESKGAPRIDYEEVLCFEKWSDH